MPATPSDDRGAQVADDTVTDSTLDEVLRAAGFELTETGREHWRQRLAVPISAEALDEGRRMRDRARGRAA
jgi:hypothetical protein